MPTNGYVLKELTKHAMNALNSSNISDAEVLPLATAQALRNLFINRQAPPPSSWTQRQDMEFHEEGSIGVAIGAGIFTDANVAAADTMAGLRNILIAANPDLTATFQSGNRGWQ